MKLMSPFLSFLENTDYTHYNAPTCNRCIIPRMSIKKSKQSSVPSVIKFQGDMRMIHLHSVVKDICMHCMVSVGPVVASVLSS